MKKKIYISDESAVSAAIDAAQARSRARCIFYRDILRGVETVDASIGCISKTAKIGTTAVVDIHGERLPSAYKYPAESTQYKVEYTRRGWALVWVERRRTGETSRRFWVELSESAKSAILSRIETAE